MGQLDTWFSMLLYGLTPTLLATIIAFLVFWIAHARGLKFAGEGLGRYPLYARISTAALFLVAIVVASSTMDTWTAVRYFGGRDVSGAAASWRDPAFGHPLSFYFFQLPFYTVMLHLVLAIAVVAIIIYWLSARAWQLRRSMPDIRETGIAIDLRSLQLTGALESFFLRTLAAVLLLAFAASFLLHRYDLLLSDHGFMVGIDYVDQNITIPLLWLVAASCVAATVAVWLRRPRYVLIVVAAIFLRAIVPPIVASVWVRPNEISLERPFIQRHIDATRSAFALDRRTSEVDFPDESRRARRSRCEQAPARQRPSLGLAGVPRNRVADAAAASLYLLRHRRGPLYH